MVPARLVSTTAPDLTPHPPPHTCRTDAPPPCTTDLPPPPPPFSKAGIKNVVRVNPINPYATENKEGGNARDYSSLGMAFAVFALSPHPLALP